MTPERAARLVARWVRRYTRDLPPAEAERRIGELDADLHDQIAHERGRGTPDRRIARGIIVRMVRGVPADAAWRRERTPSSRRRPLAVIALVTTLVLLVPAIGMLVTNDTGWGVMDFVLAGALVAGSGLLIETALRRRATLVHRSLTAAVGVACVVLGEADDAPGLVGFGGLLLLATVALAVRTARRSG